MQAGRKRTIAFAILTSLALFVFFVTLSFGLAWINTYNSERAKLNLLSEKIRHFYDLKLSHIVKSANLVHINGHNCKKINSQLEKISLNDAAISLALLVNDENQQFICHNTKNQIQLPKLSTLPLSLSGPYDLKLFNEPVLLLTKKLKENRRLVFIIDKSAITPDSLLSAESDIKGSLYIKSDTPPLPLIAFGKESDEKTYHPPYRPPLVTHLTISQVPNLVLKTSIQNNMLRKALIHHLKLLSIFFLIMVSISIYMVVRLTKHRLSLKQALKVAIENDDLIPYYQPVIDLKSDKCVGCEVLVRWIGPNDEMIYPDTFIPVAEKTGMILPLTNNIMLQAFKELSPMLKANPDNHIAFNIVAEHFENDKLLKFCLNLCKKHQVSPKQIIFELTEREMIDESNHHALAIMDTIKKSGISLALDDFGTGFSSMSCLRQYSFDYLKIDKQFIMSAGSGAVTETLAENMISLAKNLNMKVIAEGVENQSHAHFLKSQNVEYAQGYLYNKALPLDEFLKYHASY